MKKSNVNRCKKCETLVIVTGVLQCDYLNGGGESVSPRVLFLSIGFLLPLVMIVASYFTIWRTTIKSSSFLKLNS